MSEFMGEATQIEEEDGDARSESLLGRSAFSTSAGGIAKIVEGSKTKIGWLLSSGSPKCSSRRWRSSRTWTACWM